ncbi:MAG TPA: sigma-70 family RNA polymerase sigma factor [Terracidiphilus sp.]|jgi:RNA polymerase sigma factor (sigma-70 family)|nr:sigma-70 family RNA polymerase sigma factor [Terracidiphilus sp.]
MTRDSLNTLLDLRRKFLDFVAHRVGDPALAEDILQGAYARALEASGNLREEESAVAWFYRILRNAIIDNHRRRATEAAALERWMRDLESAPEPVPQLLDATCECIASALDRITPQYASLIRDVDLDEITLSDYARRQRITPGNAAVRAHRARTALRRQLMQCCGLCSAHGCLNCTCHRSTHA